MPKSNNCAVMRSRSRGRVAREACRGKNWFTAAELAAWKLPGLSGSKRKINERVDTEGWRFRTNADGSPMARDRKGRGGGFEFHVDLLPAAARAGLAAMGVAIVADVSVQPETRLGQMWRWFEGESDKTKAIARKRAAIVMMVRSFRAAGLSIRQRLLLPPHSRRWALPPLDLAGAGRRYPGRRSVAVSSRCAACGRRPRSRDRP